MKKPTILCVDDEKDILDTLFSLFLDEFKDEYDIELAETGDEAITIYNDCKENCIDIPLIIADYIMPGMKGDELLIQMHQRHPQMIKILLTGQATLEGVTNAYENAKLYRYFSKPWEKHDLIITVREALKSYYRNQKLVSVEKKYKRIFDRAVEGIFQTTPEGNIIIVNPALIKTLGYNSIEEILKIYNIQKMFANPEGNNTLLEKIDRKMEMVEFESQMYKKDGDIIWVEIFASPVLNNDGQIRKIEGFIRNITQRKKAQQELEDYQKHLEQIIEDRTQEIRDKNNKILKINAELKKLSITDRLTGLYNRHKLDEVLESEHHRAMRYKSKYSLIIIDIDFFKSVNDTHGHQVGDKVLVNLSAILKENVRKVDTVGRWGGEEFIIICPETTLEGAVLIAEKMREKVANHIFPVVKTKTISLGVAEFIVNDTIDDIIKRADDSLYSAKHNGRNRVEYHKN